jgi:hypothetical protein
VKVWEAREVAARWVAEHAGEIPNFVGAFISGSVAWLPLDADLPATSDVDVMVVIADERVPPKPGKILYDGVLVEITFLSRNQISSSEKVLASYHLAGAFRTNTVLADPTGRLTELQAETARKYSERPWVRRRCADAERRIADGLASVQQPRPLYDQVMGWVFATGVTTHVLLTAGLRNPTIRLRYLAARTLLHTYGRLEFHEELLRLLGCAHLSRARAAQHVRAMAEVFDAAATAVTTPFLFATDITAEARPIAVGGSLDLIEEGNHREAVFWVVATYARCLKILATDAPASTRAFTPGFADLLGDLGFTSPADVTRRAQDVHDFLPRLSEMKEEILAVNPDIEDPAG